MKFVLLLLVLMGVCSGSRILLVFPSPSRSHVNLGDGYVRNLLKAGHEVTYITPMLPKISDTKLRYIVVNETFLVMSGKTLNVDALMRKEVELDNHYIFQMLYNVSEITLENEGVKKLLNDPREHFDLVIAERMFNEIYSGFSAVFNCPYIWFFPYEPDFVALSLIDEAPNPAYTTNAAFSHTPPFTFMQRIEMLWYQIVTIVTTTLAFDTAVAKRGRVLPPYEDIRLNASMMLGNTHPSFGTTTRLPQNFKSIGGYHIDPDVKPLPQDLQKIMDSSKHGVIYFSMGSNLKSKDFPDKIKTSLLEMFGKLRQTIIWKFEESFINLPKNVHIVNWAPQQSILAHPNCVFFITHGGLLSSTESVHFGVPMIGIPVFFDQFINIDRAEKKGIAKKVYLSYEMARDLKDAIDEMTNNPRYKERMKEVSFYYHNRPVTPGQELIHWVEHVIATGGAVYLRSPALQVPLYQKMYLDLLAVIALMIYAVQRFISFQIFTSKRNRQPKKKRY